MNVDFTLLSPGGNSTIIVQSPVSAGMRAAITQKLLAKEFLRAEQVGFLLEDDSECDAQFEMMGGELSVNGLRAAAAVVSYQSNQASVTLRTSATRECVPFTCRRDDNGLYVSIDLTLPTVRLRKLGDMTIVFLQGIAQVLLPVQESVTSEEALELFEDARKRCADDLYGFPAIGVIPYWKSRGAYSIAPVIYVRDTDTLVPETGCGSGSVALAVKLSQDLPDMQYAIRQPSGTVYDVALSKSGESVTATLGSPVDVLLTGTVYL